jgi:hypothetical protein
LVKLTVGLSTANAANKLIDHLVANAAFTQPAGTFFKLHTADPGASGATAAAAGDTSRKTADYAAAASGTASQNASAGPWTNGGTSETITHISVWDASTSGNFLYSFALSSGQAWASGNTFTMTSYSFALTPLAA